MRGVELGGQAIHVIRKQVAVAVESHLDAGVAELRLDRLRVGALGDKQGGACMAEIVDAQILRKACAASAGRHIRERKFEFRRGPPPALVNTRESGSRATSRARCAASISRRNPGITTEQMAREFVDDLLGGIGVQVEICPEQPAVPHVAPPTTGVLVEAQPSDEQAAQQRDASYGGGVLAWAMTLWHRAHPLFGPPPIEEPTVHRAMEADKPTHTVVRCDLALAHERKRRRQIGEFVRLEAAYALA